jgi:hypothetical protein
MKARNKLKKEQVERWLYRGVCAEIIYLTKSRATRKIKSRERLKNFKNRWN